MVGHVGPTPLLEIRGLANRFARSRRGRASAGRELEPFMSSNYWSKK